MLNNVVSRYLAKTARITEQKAYITYLPGGSGHTRGDVAYLRVEGNTFPIKDELRAAGLRWLTKYWGLEASTYSPYDRNWQRTLAAMKAAYPKVKAIVDKFNAEVEERNKALKPTPKDKAEAAKHFSDLLLKLKYLSDAGLNLGTTSKWDGSPELGAYITGNTLPFAAVFKQFKMKWSSFADSSGRMVRGWIMPNDDFDVIESRLMAALAPAIAKWKQTTATTTPGTYPWSGGEAALVNTEIEDEAEDTGVTFNKINATSVQVVYNYMSPEYVTYSGGLQGRRMTNEDALKLWNSLLATRRYKVSQGGAAW